jgi:hypothetical protein
MRIAYVSLSLALASLPAAAGTWIVDDDGPADFTTIQAAIDAAAPGDVILVLGGTYPGFTFDTAVTVLGLPAVEVNGPARIEGVSDGSFAVLSNLRVEDLDVSSCTATIVIDEVIVGPAAQLAEVSVSTSTDVRFRKLLPANPFAPLRMEVDPSRVELCDSELRGIPGKDCTFSCAINPTCVPGNALPALQLGGAGSTVHAYRTSLLGAKGGYMCKICCDGKASQAVLGAMDVQVLLAGQPIHNISPSCDPSCAHAVTLSGNSIGRISGVSLNGTVQTLSGSSIQFPSLADPTLHILQQVGAGGTLTFRVNAPVGSSAALNVGRFPDLVQISGISEDLLVKTLRTFELGPVDANGVVGFNFPLPGYLTTGSTFFAQARVTMPDGTTRYTNSVPMIVR